VRLEYPVELYMTASTSELYMTASTSEVYITASTLELYITASTLELYIIASTLELYITASTSELYIIATRRQRMEKSHSDRPRTENQPIFSILPGSLSIFTEITEYAYLA